MSKFPFRIWIAALVLALGAKLACAQIANPYPGSIAPNAAPEQVLRTLISQVQTGAVDPHFIGPELWQIIAMQTNNTGVYGQLVQLGKVTGVEVVGRRELPAGPVFSMVATHTSGASTWLLGISQLTRKVEYASYGINTAAPSLPAQPDPGKPSSPQSEACRKFPNLCP